MKQENRLKISKKIRVFAVAVIVVFALFLMGRFLIAKDVIIPLEFQIAHQEAIVVADEIVSLSDISAKKIWEISQLADKGKYGDAINLTKAEIQKNQELREKALQLSADLEIMARASAKISSEAAAREAIEAVSVEMALISQLINYNGYLYEILDILKQRVLGITANYNEINNLIEKANREANFINSTNEKFNEMMRKIDPERR